MTQVSLSLNGSKRERTPALNRGVAHVSIKMMHNNPGPGASRPVTWVVIHFFPPLKTNYDK